MKEIVNATETDELKKSLEALRYFLEDAFEIMKSILKEIFRVFQEILSHLLKWFEIQSREALSWRLKGFGLPAKLSEWLAHSWPKRLMPYKWIWSG